MSHLVISSSSNLSDEATRNSQVGKSQFNRNNVENEVVIEGYI